VPQHLLISVDVKRPAPEIAPIVNRGASTPASFVLGAVLLVFETFDLHVSGGLVGEMHQDMRLVALMALEPAL
jgi:hypothetical protein